MRIRKGLYQTDEDTVLVSGVSIQPVPSGYGDIPHFFRKKLDLKGHLFGTSQSDINTKILALEAAFLKSGESVEFLQDGGANTAHSLIYADSIEGIKLLDFGWESAQGGEFATVRTWRASFEGTFINTAVNVDAIEIIEYQDQFSIEGGLPEVFVVPSVTGQPVEYQTKAFTPYLASQSGRIVGRTDYPAPPSVQVALASKIRRNSITYARPRVTRVDPNDGAVEAYTGYEVRWDRQYSSATSISAPPWGVIP